MFPFRAGSARSPRRSVLDAAPDRSRFASESCASRTARRRRTRASTRGCGTCARRYSARVDEADVVPVPLSAAFWSDAVFRTKVGAADFRPSWPIAALRSFAGLAASDDETLAFFAAHGRRATDLRARCNGIRRLPIRPPVHDGHVAVPGAGLARSGATDAPSRSGKRSSASRHRGRSGSCRRSSRAMAAAPPISTTPLRISTRRTLALLSACGCRATRRVWSGSRRLRGAATARSASRDQDASVFEAGLRRRVRTRPRPRGRIGGAGPTLVARLLACGARERPARSRRARSGW